MSHQVETPNWRQRFVHSVYATHNESPQIKQALQKCLSRLQQNEIGLNIGAGYTKLHPAMFNIDLIADSFINCQAKAEHLPFANASFSLIATQETLEHVQDPHLAVAEMYRVLRDGGTLYCQLPFIIGYHPGPTDYWRFSKEGIRELIEKAGFQCDEVAIAVGGGTGFYRIAVEFTATVFSRFFSPLYRPIKGGMALILFPLKWLDPLLSSGDQADRIAGGYYVIAKKNDSY